MYIINMADPKYDANNEVIDHLNKLEGQWKDIDKALIDLLEMTESMEYLCIQSHISYSKQQKYVKYVTFGISSFSTITNLVSTYVKAGGKDDPATGSTTVAFDSLNLVSSILLTVGTSLALVLKYDDLAKQFKDGGNSFAVLNGQLTALLHTNHEDRKLLQLSPIQFYLRIKKDYDNIGRGLPPFPNKVLQQYMIKFKDNKATKPIIGDAIIDYDPDRDGVLNN